MLCRNTREREREKERENGAGAWSNLEPKTVLGGEGEGEGAAKLVRVECKFDPFGWAHDLLAPTKSKSATNRIFHLAWASLLSQVPSFASWGFFNKGNKSTKPSPQQKSSHIPKRETSIHGTLPLLYDMREREREWAYERTFHPSNIKTWLL